jgi:hypothetical protein
LWEKKRKEFNQKGWRDPEQVVSVTRMRLREVRSSIVKTTALRLLSLTEMCSQLEPSETNRIKEEQPSHLGQGISKAGNQAAPPTEEGH